MVVKIMVRFWVLSLVQHLVFRRPKRDHNFDNHPNRGFQRLGVPFGSLYVKDFVISVQVPLIFGSSQIEVWKTHTWRLMGLGTTCDLAYNPTCNLGNPYKAN